MSPGLRNSLLETLIDIVGGSILLLLLIPVSFLWRSGQGRFNRPFILPARTDRSSGTTFYLMEVPDHDRQRRHETHEEHLRNLIHSDAAMEKLTTLTTA